MKLLNEFKKEFKKEFENQEFDLKHESNMVQSRILSPIVKAIDKQGITQEELSKRTGLKQPFISGLLNIRKKLNMEHIARFQKALNIVIQPPPVLSLKEHRNKFYNVEEYNYIADENSSMWSDFRFANFTGSIKMVCINKAANYSKQVIKSTDKMKSEEYSAENSYL